MFIGIIAEPKKENELDRRIILFEEHIYLVMDNAGVHLI
jgi:hypothetical protein